MNLLFNPNVNIFLSKLDDRASMASVVLRDGADNVGRAYQAYKRDPHDGRERMIEENLTMLIWGFGIRLMKDRVYDPLVRAMTSVKYPWLDMGLLKEGPQQLTADVVKKYAPKDTHLLKLITNGALERTYHSSNVARFLLTTGIPIGIIAFAIPTFNQWLTRKKVAESQPVSNPKAMPFGRQPMVSLRKPSLFAHFDGGQPAGRQMGALSPQAVQFGSGLGSFSTHLSNIIQNDRWNNLFVDGTISGGRTFKARNLWERLEVMFQEAATIFFLYFAQGIIQGKMEKALDGRIGTLSHLGFGQIKTLADRYKGQPEQFLAAYQRSVAPMLGDLSEAAVVPQARAYVAGNAKGHLLFDLAREAGWIPTLKQGNGHTALDLTRRIQTDNIERLAKQLDTLATRMQANPQQLAAVLKRSMGWKFSAFLASSAVCTAFLGNIIPRLKQEMTYRFTGSREFPGIMNTAESARI